MTKISVEEYTRRHSQVQHKMREDGFDVLVVAARDDIRGRGNLRYLTDLTGGGYLVFPVDGPAVYFVHPVHAASPKPSRDRPIEGFVTIQVYADGAYGDPVLDVLTELRKRGIRERIGLVGLRDVGAPVFQALTEYADDTVRDATYILQQARMVKTPEMLVQSRLSAKLADEAYEILASIAEPGVSDYELYAAVKHHLYRHGSEYSLDVIDAEGAMMNFTWGPTGEKLSAGGHLFMEITPAVGGVYAQLPFCLPVGDLAPNVQRLRDAWQAGFLAGEQLLKPGVAVSDISKAMKSVIQDFGYLTPFAQGHSIGFDVVDGWAIGDATHVTLQPGMTLALHPAAVEKLGGDAFTCGHTYLITDSGAERLSTLNFTQ